MSETRKDHVMSETRCLKHLPLRFLQVYYSYKFTTYALFANLQNPFQHTHASLPHPNPSVPVHTGMPNMPSTVGRNNESTPNNFW